MLNPATRYETTEHRVFIALNIAAALGTTPFLLLYTGSAISHGTLWSFSRSELVELGFFYFFVHVVWFFAILCIGGPVWLVMHKYGFRHWVHAGIAGGAILGAACLALLTKFFSLYSDSSLGMTNSSGQWIWQDGRLTAEGWTNALGTSLWVSLLGALLGLIIWRIAYRRVAGTV